MKLSKDSIDLTKKLDEEAAKGKGANEKEIVKLIKSLDAKCVVCHNKFRDD
jgi:cytochrome c556